MTAKSLFIKSFYIISCIKVSLSALTSSTLLALSFTSSKTDEIFFSNTSGSNLAPSNIDEALHRSIKEEVILKSLTMPFFALYDISIGTFLKTPSLLNSKAGVFPHVHSQLLYF